VSSLVGALRLVILVAPAVTAPAAVDAALAVERARYAFVIGATRSFEEAYPRAVFERRVARQKKEEAVLATVFGVVLTREVLANEYERIETATKAPDQWEAVKKALGNDRRRVEEAFCRPLAVERELRARFALDAGIHAEAHTRARAARSRFLAGGRVDGARTLRLSRRAPPVQRTDTWLEAAKAQVRGPQVLGGAGNPEVVEVDEPVVLEPRAQSVLEAQLRKAGDVSTILSERDRFSVYRLLAETADAWTVEAAVYPKRDFESWLSSRPECAPRENEG
jgi:hypothetical protein